MPLQTVTVRLTGNATDLIRAIQSVSGPATKLKATISGINLNVKQMGTVAQSTQKSIGGFASSVGAFYLLHQASTLAANAMRTGFSAAADLEFQMNKLGFVSKASAGQLKYMRQQALELSSALGPVAVTDVVKAQQAIARIIGPGQQKIIPDFAPQMSSFLNAMMLLSPGAGVDQTLAQAQQIISAFGGFKGGDKGRLDEVGKLLDYLQKAFQISGQLTLEGVVRGIRIPAPSLTGIGMSPKDVMGLAIMRNLYPVGGPRGTGADIEAFVAQLMTVNSDMTKGSKRMNERRGAAFRRFGLVNKEGQPTFLNAEGKPDLVRALVSMTRSIDVMRKTMPPGKFAVELMDTFQDAFKRDIARRFGKIFIDPNTVAVLQSILDKLETGFDLSKVDEILTRGLMGSWQRFTSNIENVFASAFYRPAGVMAPLLEKLAKALENLTNLMEKNPRAQAAAGVGIAGIGTGISGSVLSVMFLGAANALGGAGGIAGLVAMGLRVIGTVLAISSVGLLIAGAVASIVLAASYAYRYSPMIRHATDTAKDWILERLRKIIPSPEELKARRVPGSTYNSWQVVWGNVAYEIFYWGGIGVGWIGDKLAWLAEEIFYYMGRALDKLVDLGIWVKGWGLRMWEGVLEAAEWYGTLADDIGEAFTGWIRDIRGAIFKAVWNSLNPWNIGTMTWGDVWNTFKSDVGKANTTARDRLADTVAGAKSDVKQKWKASGDKLTDWIMSARPNPRKYPKGFVGPPAPYIPEESEYWPDSLAEAVHAPPTQEKKMTDEERRNKEFGEKIPPLKGPEGYPDVPPSQDNATNSNARTAATISQMEQLFNKLFNQAITNQSIGMARTGTINRQHMPLRAR